MIFFLSLFIGLITGFFISIPIGPINVWVINTSIKKGQLNALFIALGGSLMDFIYFFIILSGLSIFEFEIKTIIILKTLGIIFVFALGIKELFTSIDLKLLEKNRKTPRSLIKAFMLGIIIYISNPVLLISMTAVATFIKSLELFPMQEATIFINAFGLGLGAFLWSAILIKIVKRYQESIRERYLQKVTKISGGLMVGLAILMSYQLIVI